MEDGKRTTNAKDKPDWKTFTGKVLVAEDNPANRILIETLLKKHGLEVTLTEDGKQAVEAVTQIDSFDLILMDMQMPVMNGYEATEALREKGFTRPIIALTASVMVGDRKKCLDSGCDDYVSKPINRQQLQDVLTSVFTSADPVHQQIDQISDQAQQINKLIDEATPTVPQSILNDTNEED